MVSDIMEDLLSLHFGNLDLKSAGLNSESAVCERRSTVIKNIVHTTRSMLEVHRSSPANANEAKTSRNELAHVFKKLGHLHLLVFDFRKALSAYQKYVVLASWRMEDVQDVGDLNFLYGIGLVYYHFNAFFWAKLIFQRLLYSCPDFKRAGEVHLRLGLINKFQHRYVLAHKHLNIAMLDNEPCTLSKPEIKFHIAHCYELEGYFLLARNNYEQILSNSSSGSQLPNSIKAIIARQLGWLFHRVPQFGENAVERQSLAIQYLQDSIKYSPGAGETWYYLGRCFASIPGRAHEAFVAYRHSIDKSESSADTWCSIGVLYQQQNQPMDALQAYICAVQLDRTHASAWIDLGLLYESSSQFGDSLQCYMNAMRNLNNYHCKGGFQAGVLEALTSRLSVLQSHLSAAQQREKLEKVAGNTLPCLEEAWKLPIPAELTTRQTQIHQNKIRQCVEGPALSRLAEPDGSVKKPPVFLTPQQLQLMNMLHQNQARLSPQDAQLLRQLQSQFAAMQQYLKSQQELNNHPGDFIASLSNQTMSAEPAKEAPNPSHANANQFLPQGMTSSNHVQAPQQMDTGEDLPQVSQEDLAALFGNLPECKASGGTDLTDDLFGAFGVGADDDVKINAANSDPLLSDAALPAGFSLDLGTSSAANQSVPLEGSQARMGDTGVSGGPGVAFEQQPESKSPGQRSEKRVPPLSLLGACNLKITMRAGEVVEACKAFWHHNEPRVAQAENANAGSAEENWILPKARLPPMPSSKDRKVIKDPKCLILSTPVVHIENKREALAQELQEFCHQNPLAVLRSMAAALKLDLGLFSSKSLVRVNSEAVATCSSQYLHSPTENTNAAGKRVWRSDAGGTAEARTNVGKYAQYQAQTFQKALKEEQDRIKQCSRSHLDHISLAFDPFSKKSRAPHGQSLDAVDEEKTVVKCCSGIDISDDRLWEPQLMQLARLPGFLKVSAACNLISHMGLIIPGVNGPQVSMKVPGSRETATLEPCALARVNINIGPGDCEWFAVPNEYVLELRRFCEREFLDYRRDKWWPCLEDCAKARIPVFRFVQRPGDLVFIGPGTIHWHESLGWSNDISWNIGPMTATQVKLSLTGYEYDRLEGFKAKIPMEHLCWKLAKNVRFTEPELYQLVKDAILRSFAHCVLLTEHLQEVNLQLHKVPKDMAGTDKHGVVDNRGAHFCAQCEQEVWNVLFVREANAKFLINCFYCAKMISPSFDGFTGFCQQSLEELSEIYDDFQKHNRVFGVSA